MNRRQVLEAQINQHETFESYANFPETYQEDRAFMNRMRRFHFRDMGEADLKRLWGIAQRGLDHREKVEKEIAAVAREIEVRQEDGTINCGYKLGWKLQEELVRLKGLR